MATRSERLQRLVTGFQCEAAWDEMDGAGSRRHCSACGREVFDVAQMTPRAVAAQIQATRGKLCARLTREGDRLVMATPVAPPEATAPAPRSRASAIAAGLVAAWLSAGALDAESPARETGALAAPNEGRDERPAPPRGAADSGPSAALRGRVADEGRAVAGVSVAARNTLDGRQHMARSGEDGSFAFSDLPAGIYELSGNAAGYDVDGHGAIALQPGEAREADLAATEVKGHATLGVVIATAATLRDAFDESDLVVAAVTGPTVVVAHQEGVAEVMTELRVESTLKGRATARRVSYWHWESVDEHGDAAAWREELAPGTEVVAFLEESTREPGSSGLAVYEAIDFGGVKVLSDSARAAYVERIEALARVEVRAARRGESDPAELAEWLVGTVEEPETRGEATAELARSIDALRDLAGSQEGTDVAAGDLRVLVERFRDGGGRLSEAPQPALVAAFLTRAHRERLTAALVATETLSQTDLELFTIVRGWNEEAAMGWLAARFRGEPPKDEARTAWWFAYLAEKLELGALTAVAEAAMTRENEIGELWSGDESAPTAALRQERLDALYRDLWQQFAEALASPR